MNYWLVKSEPETYSWDTLVKEWKEKPVTSDKLAGKQAGRWDGVRNYQARNNLQAMKKGDKVLFYHSVIGKAVVGIAQVVVEHYPDPTIDDPRWVAVNLKPVKKLKNAVSLETVKNNKDLSEMFLVTHSRLSVQPVKEKEYKKILKLSGD